jgi:hypothetical protein
MLVLFGLLGCATERPAAQDADGTGVPPIFSPQIPSLTDTVLPSIASTPRTAIAPSYEQIQAALTSIREDASLRYLEQRERAGEYADQLWHAEVEGWVGWLRDIGVFDRDEPTYNVGIYMTEKPLGKVWPIDIILFEVPREQLEDLHIWQDPTQVTGPWQKVRFSGTIEGIGLSGLMSLENVTLEPLD